jgi:hypothetical protein
VLSLKKFRESIKEDLILLHLKEAYGSITFDMYSFYQFVSAYKQINEESEFKIKEDGIQIKQMDPSRVVLMTISLKNDSYRFFKKGTIGINLDDLETTLKCNKADNQEVTLIFGETYLFLEIYSETYKTTINRTLAALDLEFDEIPMEALQNTRYPGQFGLTKTQLNYILRNCGIYSDVVSILLSPDKVKFMESGQIGEQDINFEEKDLKTCGIDLDLIKKTLDDKDEEDDGNYITEKYQEILTSKTVSGTYSLAFFKIIGKIASILSDLDEIIVELLTDSPLRALMDLKELGTSNIEFYLSPRVEEAEEFEDDGSELY